jgi:hypothetical protein
MPDCAVLEEWYPSPLPECYGTRMRCWMLEYSTVVIVIISIYFVFLIILLVAGILVPNSDLKQRINTIFIQDTQLLT